MKGILFRALQENTPLEMIYLSADHTLSQRKVMIREVHDHYTRAFCFVRQQMRTFKYDNILSILPAKKAQRVM